MSELSDYKRCVSEPYEAQLLATIRDLRAVLTLFKDGRSEQEAEHYALQRRVRSSQFRKARADLAAAKLRIQGFRAEALASVGSFEASGGDYNLGRAAAFREIAIGLRALLATTPPAAEEA